MHISSCIDYIVRVSGEQQQGPDLDCAAVQILVGSVSVPDGSKGWHAVPEGHPDWQQGVSAGIAKSPSAGVAMGTHSLLWGQGAAALCQG